MHQSVGISVSPLTAHELYKLTSLQPNHEIAYLRFISKDREEAHTALPLHHHPNYRLRKTRRPSRRYPVLAVRTQVGRCLAWQQPHPYDPREAQLPGPKTVVKVVIRAGSLQALVFSSLGGCRSFLTSQLPLPSMLIISLSRCENPTKGWVSPR